jgi:predicted amidophosphoribosyltransferase
VAMATGRARRSSLDWFAAQPAGSRCRRPSPHTGRLCPRLGGAFARAAGRECGLSRDKVRPMETMLSELVLMALLLAVVLVSGKV